MTVNVVKGNIFESDCEVITDANNAIGISGAGIALAFAKRYPQLSDYYNKYCQAMQLRFPNRVLLAPIIFQKGFLDNKDYAVCKFPTMILPGEVCKIENINANLAELNLQIKMRDYKSIALPALGCGIGRLPFDDLVAAVREIFDNEAFRVDIHEPF